MAGGMIASVIARSESDEAIQPSSPRLSGIFASLAMTAGARFSELKGKDV
jgi:hypothetical protein